MRLRPSRASKTDRRGAVKADTIDRPINIERTGGRGRASPAPATAHRARGGEPEVRRLASAPDRPIVPENAPAGAALPSAAAAADEVNRSPKQARGTSHVAKGLKILLKSP